MPSRSAARREAPYLDARHTAAATRPLLLRETPTPRKRKAKLLALPSRLPQRIGIFVVPNFAMMSFSPMIEAQHLANRMSGRELYSWHVLSKNGDPVAASNGVSIKAEASLADAGQYDHLIVIADTDGHRYADAEVFAQLRRVAQRGMTLGAVSLGSYLLARAGLLDGYRCTVHWDNLLGFTEAFPHLDVSSDLFEIDRDRFTCSGGSAAIDMMLHVIAAQHGSRLATSVADQFLLERIRNNHDRQRMALSARLGFCQPKLLNAVRHMEENLEDPASRMELAGSAKVSPRQLERLFRRYLRLTPMNFYRQLRLDKARRLLRQTEMTVLEVAVACGFESLSHFSKCYRRQFQTTPGAERRRPG